MGKIFRGLSDESVWLKSLAEHDNVDKFVQLTCSASDFNHIYAFITGSIHIVHQEYYVPLMHKRKNAT